MSETTTTAPLTTAEAVEAVAWGRAPKARHASNVNRRIVCADGFKVSVQASSWHYANDREGAPYWRDGVNDDAEVFWPYVTFEVGAVTADPKPKKVWREYDSAGVWAWVPRQVVADLLDRHGGAVAWEEPREARKASS